MPGKYSHSVVLADFSNRGIIVLPPDQHEKYITHYLQPVKGPERSRLRGTRSAQAIGHQAWSPLAPDGKRLFVDQPHPSLTPMTEHRKSRRQILPDDDLDRIRSAGFSKKLYLESLSTPDVKMSASKSTESVPLQNGRGKASASRPRERSPPPPLPVSSLLVPSALTVSKPNGPLPSGIMSTVERIRERARAPTLKNSSKGTQNDVPKSPQDRVPNQGSEERSDRSNVKDKVASTDSSKPESSRSAASRTRPRVTSLTLPEQTLLAGQDLGPASPRRFGRQETGLPSPTSPVMSDVSTRRVEAATPQPADDKEYETAAIRDLIEPNFDGFNDSDVPVDYFDYSKSSSLAAQSQKPKLTPEMNKPTSSHEAPRYQVGSVTPRASRQAHAAEADIRNTPSTTTAASTMFSQRLRSDSSASSNSMLMGAMQNALDIPFGSPIRSSEDTGMDKSWRLPEIKEDVGFSPSIFEDNEGEFGVPQFDFADLDGSLGQISAGRDVDFDNDAASELSAAMPPPISKFKNEEDEFNANLTKLFGAEASNMLLSKGKTGGPGRSSTKSSRKLFAKFRSKTSLNGK